MIQAQETNMRHLMPFLAAAASVLSTAVAYADLGDQLAKLLPNDGAAEDYFGHSVAIRGTAAIVGAYQDDDNGRLSGSAYLFDANTGRQVAKLLPNDGAAHDWFGWSVAISGATAIVTAPRDDDNDPNSGSAYLFDISDPANPTQITKLLPNDGAGDDWFGYSVAISGTTAIVGARWDDDNGFHSGSAYLFDISDPANPIQIAKLLAKDGAAVDTFGVSVAISGATAVVGAWGDDDNGDRSGSAYLFDTTTGWQVAKLLADDGAAFDRFGWSVGISGATAIVGAYLDDDNGLNSGSAYLFDATTGRQIAKLLARDGAAVDHFGYSVAISGETAIVGLPLHDTGSGSGSAYLFDTTTGRQIVKLLPNDGAVGDEFGRSVAISGATAIVGARRDDDECRADPFCDSGSAYLFDAAAPGKCPWDLDADGTVGILDLLALLAAWGTDPVGPPDFDGDGVVGILDLLTLLANWGRCA